MSGQCCSPSRSHGTAPGRADTPTPTHGNAWGHAVPQAHIPAGTFAMGDGYGDGNRPDGEDPVHLVHVSAFDIDTTSVTVADFARFVGATGYRTEAETFGYSAVFHLVVADDADVVGRPPGTPWWVGVRGADWRHPEGPHSDTLGREDHPVVHVSWNDAQAYCAWAGRRLPTEAEWERASRGGIDGARYPWGNELMAPDGSWRCNIWQGSFPTTNTAEDGWVTTAPVQSFLPNGFGLWQTVGNVWEWCADVFDANTYARLAHDTVRDPRGPEPAGARILRGGSYLCHDSYCNRYRNSARSSNTPDSSMGNAGFRTVSQ
jgi:formylglycine-generating enzyme